MIQKNKKILFNIKKLVQFCCATYLDQFLTLTWTVFTWEICFLFFEVETTIFILLLAKHANFKDTQKTISEHTCANSSCQNVRFFCVFHFGGFRNFHFLRDVFDRSAKIQKITKYQSNKTKNNNKKTENKTKNLILWFKTKQKNKQKTITNEHLETKNKQNKNKRQEPETEMRNRKDGSEKKTKERTKNEKVKREEAQKRLKRNKGRHRKITKNVLF